MSNHDPSPAVFTPPKISAAKVLERIKAMKLRSYDVADKLNLTPGALSRGVRSQKWLNAKISELSAILEVHETELFVDPEDHNWLSPLERACGKPGKNGHYLPIGCTIRPLLVQNKWELMLVAPAEVPVSNGDLVLMTAKDANRPTVEIKHVGRLYADKSDESQWIIASGPDRTPLTVPKSLVISICVVISNLGDKAWGER